MEGSSNPIILLYKAVRFFFVNISLTTKLIVFSVTGKNNSCHEMVSGYFLPHSLENRTLRWQGRNHQIYQRRVTSNGTLDSNRIKTTQKSWNIPVLMANLLLKHQKLPQRKWLHTAYKKQYLSEMDGTLVFFHLLD